MSQPTDDPIRVGAGLPLDEYERLKQLAKDNERSIAAEIRIAVRKHVDASVPEHVAATKS